MRYYDKLAEYEREGYTVIVDKSWEDLNPRDMFEEEDADEVCRKIDNGTYDWFMLRVRVLVEGLELSSEYLGGCCYENAAEVLTDGTAEDKIHEALASAKKDVYRLSKVFAALNEEIEREGVTQ
jgi:hypothetical protein